MEKGSEQRADCGVENARRRCDKSAEAEGNANNRNAMDQEKSQKLHSVSLAIRHVFRGAALQPTSENLHDPAGPQDYKTVCREVNPLFKKSMLSR